MPNHCDNELVIVGPTEAVNKIIEKYFTQKGELMFDRVVPYPIEYAWDDAIAYDYEIEQEKAGKSPWEGRPQDGYNKGGYEWCNNNWGTKWSSYDGWGMNIVPSRGKNRSKAVTGFFTAWSPPMPVIHNLAAKHPEVMITLKSYEGGMGYKVYAKWKGGECVVERESSYSGGRGG